jgi:hypothetical protein
MTVNEILPFISSAIMLAFVVVVLRRWWRRKAPHMLVWGIGLSMFGVGTLMEAYFTIAWNGLAFRAWYLSGAMLTAAWIGQGSVYLLAKRPVPHVTLAILVVVSLVSLYGIATMTLDSTAASIDLSLGERYRDIMPKTWVRSPMTIILNLYGTLALVGGALYSAWLFWRKRVLQDRMWGNIFIATGALTVALGGTLSRLGYGEYLYASELAAAVLMFAGFIVASQRGGQEAAAH